MKIFVLFITCFFSTAIYSAALVHPTIMSLEHSGLIGEKGSLEPVPYKLSVEYVDKKSTWASNEQKISRLVLVVNGVEMKLNPELYKDLTGVHIPDIKVAYIQRWSDMSSIELYIPYGKREACKNHESGAAHYLQTKEVLVFSLSGNFREAVNKHACEH